MLIFFCSALATAGAPQWHLPAYHFSYPLQLIQGGLLIESDAGLLAFCPRPTHQHWGHCPRWSKSFGGHRCDHLANSGSLLLHLLVKKFERSAVRLPESGRSLWRVAWTVLTDASWAWASFMTLSRRSFSTSAAISVMDTVAVKFLCRRRGHPFSYFAFW